MTATLNALDTLAADLLEPAAPIRLMPPYVITRGGYDVTVHTFDTGTLTRITVGRITDNKFWKPGSRGDVVTRHVLALSGEIRGRVSH